MITIAQVCPPSSFQRLVRLTVEMGIIARKTLLSNNQRKTTKERKTLDSHVAGVHPEPPNLVIANSERCFVGLNVSLRPPDSSQPISLQLVPSAPPLVSSREALRRQIAGSKNYASNAAAAFMFPPA